MSQPSGGVKKRHLYGQYLTMETNWKHLPKVPHNRQERRNRAPGASESKSQVLNCSTMSMIHITVACLCCDMTPRGHPGARVEAVAKPSKQLTIVYPDQIKSCKYTIYIYISAYQLAGVACIRVWVKTWRKKKKDIGKRKATGQTGRVTNM